MPDKYWEDFELGFSFKTPSITVTETHVVNWAGLTMDFYPLHMDREFAAKTPVERLKKIFVVHGEMSQAEALKQGLEKRGYTGVVIPERLDTITV